MSSFYETKGQVVSCQSLVNVYLHCNSGSFSILPPVFNACSNLWIKISVWNFHYVVKLKACALKNSNTRKDQTHSGQTTLKAAALDAVCLCWKWRSSWLVSVSCCAWYSRAPTSHSIQRRSPSLFLSLSPPLPPLPFFPSLSPSRWVSQSGHPAHHNQMAKDAPQLSVSLSFPALHCAWPT